MHTSRASSLGFGTAFMLVAAGAPAADAPAPLVVRGTVASIDTKSISIAEADGTTFTASLAPGTSFGTVEPRHFQQINSTDFVGITSVPGPHGTLTAKEIHIMPWKGLREGSFPWDHAPGGPKPVAPANVTNGTVSAVLDDPAAYTMTNASVTASSLGKLTVTYRGSKMVDGKCAGRAADAVGAPCSGVATVDVPPSIPIVAVVPGKLTDAKVGLAVFAVVAPKSKHEWAALSLTFEKNGVKPVY
jgi:hypothetical protein